tara:strand:+ start:7142 stop:7309 length:168 start_codon:yes stop_codon:yes gene_type:complete
MYIIKFISEVKADGITYEKNSIIKTDDYTRALAFIDSKEAIFIKGKKKPTNKQKI